MPTYDSQNKNNDTPDTIESALCLDVHLTIDNEVRFRTKHFNFYGATFRKGLHMAYIFQVSLHI